MANHTETQIVSFELKKRSIPELWERFQNARNALADAFIGNEIEEDGIEEVVKEVKTISWGGYDRGIHDHRGSLHGKVNGITLSMSIKGTTFDNNPRYDVDDEGRWTHSENQETHATIEGHFISKDETEGAVKIVFKNGQPQYEAYWLCSFDLLKLKQIVCPDGKVVRANDLELDNQNWAIIPGPTDIRVPTQMPLQLTQAQTSSDFFERYR